MGAAGTRRHEPAVMASGRLADASGAASLPAGCDGGCRGARRRAGHSLGVGERLASTSQKTPRLIRATTVAGPRRRRRRGPPRGAGDPPQLARPALAWVGIDSDWLATEEPMANWHNHKA